MERERGDAVTSAAASQEPTAHSQGSGCPGGFPVGACLRRDNDDTVDMGSGSLGARFEQPHQRLTRQLLKQFWFDSEIRNHLTETIREVLNDNILKDPDMWPWAHSVLEEALNGLWKDCSHEVEQKVQMKLLGSECEKREAIRCIRTRVGPEEVSCCGGRFGVFWHNVRAFVLHHYLPHNRGFFGKWNDPVYIIMHILILLPVHGLRISFFTMVLLMLTFPGCSTERARDEFQLIQFILITKGAQFFSQAMLLTFFGAMQYFACYSWEKDHMLACVEKWGPGTGSLFGQLVDHLGSILLVWAAFFSLTTTNKRKTYTKLNKSDSNIEFRLRSGGRLRGLLLFDMKAFVWSTIVFVCLTALAYMKDPDSIWLQTGVNLYWCRVFYSIASFPFLFFMIPALQILLCHTTRTGFDEAGACVDFALPAKPSEKFFDRLNAKRRKTTVTKWQQFRKSFSERFPPLLSISDAAESIVEDARVSGAVKPTHSSAQFPSPDLESGPSEIPICKPAVLLGFASCTQPSTRQEDDDGLRGPAAGPGFLSCTQPSTRQEADGHGNPGPTRQSAAVTPQAFPETSRTKMQWMWADAGSSLGIPRTMTGRNPLRWSNLRPAIETAADLEKQSQERPVQLRSVGQRSRELMFNDPTQAARYIRGQHGGGT